MSTRLFLSENVWATLLRRFHPPTRRGLSSIAFFKIRHIIRTCLVTYISTVICQRVLSRTLWVVMNLFSNAMYIYFIKPPAVYNFADFEFFSWLMLHAQLYYMLMYVTCSSLLHAHVSRLFLFTWAKYYYFESRQIKSKSAKLNTLP